ncbi:hypothetical protein J7355_16120 [Endozoicomonas sp. G2_2]|uniref:hypothetical protein n=1 Tax=Endozoicomonas sp. G2_2 TaxID=2821092 RepID=UPI001AD953E5|nr:hypothetical protein [Endozoicomonas sp. G2_2]MBO9471616.1 hypothetical protein [Endozoicomonas sp. G2_2]
MLRKSPAIRRVERYYSRQPPNRPAWGERYQPAILAVREEAPRGSRPTIIHAAHKLNRALHLLSLAERGVVLLALYNPEVFDIHEQRVLDPGPSPHPLHGHPSKGVVADLPPLPGTWPVAEQLGYQAMHPRLSFVDEGGVRRRMPHPLVGDFLLFIDPAVPGASAYCVNWNIKSARVEFTRRLNDYTERRPTRANRAAVARHAIERTYYARAGIPTYEIAGSELPPELVNNLCDIFSAQSRPPLPATVRAQIVGRCQSIVGSDVAPHTLLEQLSWQYGIDFEQFRDTLLAAIWAREIRVDLFSRILFDRPLRPERIDALARYGDWFCRSTV